MGLLVEEVEEAFVCLGSSGLGTGKCGIAFFDFDVVVVLVFAAATILVAIFVTCLSTSISISAHIVRRLFLPVHLSG